MPVHKVNIKRNNNKLYNINGDKEYVFIGDVIQYDPENGYFPDNTDKIVLSKNSKSMDLFAMSNLNSLVNFSVYTDLTGLLGRRANGLVITDVIGRFITNAGNISNRDLSPISFIDGHLTLSKFDSKFRSLDSNSVRVKNGSDLDTVDRMHLLQTAWLKAGIKFNVLSAKTYTNQYFNLNIGARINIINADSFYRTQQDILLFEYYPELSYSVIRLKNFGMELSTKWILQRLADKEKFANQKWEWVFNPQIAFYYYPFNNPSSTIYIRFNYYANKIKDANNFYQLQFGWRTGLKLNAKK